MKFPKRSANTIVAMAALATSIMMLASCSGQAVAKDEACDALLALKLDNGVVERVEAVAAGGVLKLEDMSIKLDAPVAVCRASLRLRPTPQSDIRVEVWLPAAGAWNGKFLGSGNGGFGGGLRNSGLYVPLQQGYAGAVTDMGHEGSVLQAEWAHGNPERVVDWAHRANHEMTTAAVKVIHGYYGTGPRRSYFHGCSDGGRQALMEASRYPDDYDGIIAGAPAAAFTDLMSQAVWNNRMLAAARLTSSKTDLAKEVARSKLGLAEGRVASRLRLLDNAVRQHCDAIDGVEDGLIENPLACSFRVQSLACGPQQKDGCLDSREVSAFQAIYDGPRSREGEQLGAGFPVGDEAFAMGWNVWVNGPVAVTLGTEFFRWMVYGDKSWTPERFELERDIAAAREKLAPLINSNDPDLSAFVDGGGKLLLYHGWSDPALPAGNTVRYYQELQAHLGEAAQEHARLFMAPGMAHCFAGNGPNVFDALGALDNWVEGGVQPERIVATKFDDDEAGAMGRPAKVLRTRPLCPWPKVAKWDGHGSIDDASSFACASPD